MKFTYKECKTVEGEINISMNQIVMLRKACRKHLRKVITEGFSLDVQRYANLCNAFNKFKYEEGLIAHLPSPLTTNLITIKNYIQSGAWK